MSADPQRSAGPSRTAATEPAAAAASTPAPGTKRRASDDAQPNAVEHQHPPPSPIDDTPVTDVGSWSAPSPMGLAAAPTHAAAASSVAPSPTSASDAATRKKQRLDQSSSAVVAPPWSRLYSDALHSIFKFTSLADLTRLMSVSRRWGQAVMTMPPLAAAASLSPEVHLDGLLDCRVRRHVTALLDRASNDRPCRLPVLQLQRASVQVPWLSELVATVPAWSGDVRVVNEALPHFAKLRALDVEVEYSMPAAACNRIIQTIGGLNPATLHSLAICLPLQYNPVSFAALSALTQLRSFSFSFSDRQTPNWTPLTDTQTLELSALTSLHQLTTPYRGEVEASFFVRMLQPGHALRWTTLGSDGNPINVTAPLASLLGSLPTLMSLNAWMHCADVQFLAQLPRLTDLELIGYEARIDPAALVSALRHCSGLTRLSLSSVDCTSRHTEELLPAFPLLSSLALLELNELDSLRCLAIPATLTSLRLAWLPRCPPSELAHLFELRSLQSVRMDRKLAQSLTDEDEAAFRVPSQVFPALRSSDLSYG